MGLFRRGAKLQKWRRRAAALDPTATGLIATARGQAPIARIRNLPQGSHTQQADGLPPRQRYLAVAVIWIGMVMSVLDSSIANVALPTLAHQLNTTASQSIWVINAYQLGMVMLLLPLAACGEMLGYRRIYMTGMTAFTLASIICIFAPNLLVLALGRGLQGAGAAGMLSMNSAMVRHVYPRRLIGRALGANAFIVGASTAAAPPVASAILAVASWRWLFAVYVPFCLFVLAVGVFALPRVESIRRPFDTAGAVLSATLFGALVFGADLVSRNVDIGLGCVLLLLAIVCGVLVVRRGWNQSAPLFPIDLLRIPLFGLSIATSTASFCAQITAAISLPFLFQRGLGRSVVEIGVLMTPWPIGTAVAAALAGVLADRIPSAILNSAGLLVMAGGLLLLAFMPMDVDNLGIIWRTAICGAGFGFFQSPNNRTMVLSAPRSRSGATGGALATARTIGQSFGAVIVAMLFRALPMSQANRWALIAAAGLGVAGAVVSSLRLGRSMPAEAGAEADDTAALTDPG
jgi:DHA2 family multidrug resistance protein-like MFS transporter